MIGWLLAVWFRLKGWKINGQFPNHIPKMVIAVGPHTSAWDVVVGMAARHIIAIEHVYFLGKKELFDGMFGWFFRKMGGTPVDRFSSQGMVQQVVEKFTQHAIFRLAMSPEGTRKKVNKLRTGFYHIATQSRVPVLLAGLDFTKKEVIIGELLYPSGDEVADIKKNISFFAGVEGKHPELGMKHLARDDF